MKNLKKVLALVVALTMVLSSVASFAFTDVAEDNDAYTAVQTLSSLSILNGYEDGTFGPEKSITRAEFAAVVCRALNLESSANGAKGATQFTDVAATHWAAGYINLAAGQGIINGYGDGKFGPEDNVTYEQAVKMLVVALGYEPMAAQKGGYPTGYLVVANTYGMTKGVVAPADNAAANRGIVAQLTYNALDIPVMKQVGFGTDVVYGIYDGESYKPYTSLLTGLDVAKLEGSITATPVIDDHTAGEVEYTYTDYNDDAAWKKHYDANQVGGKAEVSLVVGEGVNVEDYFGIASIVYVREFKSGKWEIIAIMPGEDSAVVTLDRGDIETLNATELKYYESETATKTTNLKLDSVSVYLNNAASSISGILLLGADAEISVIENTGDSKYDMIIAKNYNYGIIDTVEADRDRFNVKTNGVSKRYTFDFEDEEVVNTIVNKDGEAIGLADFAEGDVIAFISDNNANVDFDWIEVINLGQNVVSGTVTEINSVTETAFIDNVEYELTSGLASSISINDEGIYYLTKTGKIFACEIDSSVSSNYAYVLEMGRSASAFSQGWQIKLLTKDGSIAIYDTKDKFVVENTVGSSATVDATTATWGAPELLFLNDLQGKTHKQEVAKRIITFKVDGNGKIRSVRQAVTDSTYNSAAGEYNANAVAIGNKALADGATIFNITGTDADDAFVTTVDTLVDETEYKGYLVMNADSEFDAVIITEGLGAIDLTQDIAVVDSINAITLNDDDAWKVRYYAGNDGELKELTLTSETVVEYTAHTIDTLAGALTKGSLFMFAADGSGVASNIALVATPNNDTVVSNAAYTVESATRTAINADEDVDLVTGYIADIKAAKNGTNITTGAGEILALKGTANAFTYYNRTASKVSIVTGDWMGANTIDRPVVNSAGTITAVSYFVAIVENGVVSDIVTFSTARNPGL